MTDWKSILIEYRDKGYRFTNVDLDDETQRINSNTILNGICVCQDLFKKSVKDFLKSGCKTCNTLALKTIPTDYTVCPKDDDDEKWIAIHGAFVSNKGRACNAFGKLCSPDERNRWYLYNPEQQARKLQYAAIIIAKAFNIPNSNLLEGQEGHYVVRYKDKNRNNYHLSNLYIGTREEVGEENGQRSHQSDRFVEVMNMSLIDKLKTTKYETVAELPQHLLFEDGNIYNDISGPGGKRFCAFTLTVHNNSNSYYTLCSSSKTYYVHRLICIGFHPIEGKKKYDDYNDKQVNHINGDTLDNRACNLEWVTASENITHAYESSLNKKVQGVIQYQKNKDGSRGEKVAEYKSIAEASRQTKIAEHEIRSSAKGQGRSLSGFLWCFKDPKKAEEWSKKFSSK